MTSQSTWTLLLAYCISASNVAHHGSETSTSQQFLAVVDPELAVICVGADNTFGHPSHVVLERLIDMLGAGSVYQKKDGTIEFITDGESLWVSDTEFPP